MTDLLGVIEDRQSTRIPFDRGRSIARVDLLQVLEAARWAPTAHNMQYFHIVVIDDRELLDAIGMIEFRVAPVFVRENVAQLSFSEEELRAKKVGLLGTRLPAWMQAPAGPAPEVSEPMPLHRVIAPCPVLLIVLHDTSKRAPASQGDVLGIMSLGCVLENMWLVAQSLGLGFQVISFLSGAFFSGSTVGQAVKDLLAVPESMQIAFAARLGHPVRLGPSASYLRVRREVDEFTHRNRFGSMGLGA